MGIAFLVLIASFESAVAGLTLAVDQETVVEHVTAWESGLSAQQVWKPEVEELEWSDIQPPTLEKPWLAKDYSPANGSAENQVVAYGVKDSEPAIQVATAKHVLPKLNLSLNAPWHRHIAMRTILRRLKDELKNGERTASELKPVQPSATVSKLIMDRASQTFYRSVGDEQIPAFTREALLLDVSDENLQPLRHEVHRTIRRQTHVIHQTLTLAAIAVAVTVVVCWLGSRFFDRVTQGYYVWPIRLATTLLFAASIGVTVMLTLSILQTLQ